jgi:hypothetical protein
LCRAFSFVINQKNPRIRSYAPLCGKKNKKIHKVHGFLHKVRRDFPSRSLRSLWQKKIADCQKNPKSLFNFEA